MENNFFLNREVLYKRTPDLGLLRYVDNAESTRFLEEVHAGVCGTQMNGFMLGKNILRAGYLLTTMENNCGLFVQKIHKNGRYMEILSKYHPMSSMQ